MMTRVFVVTWLGCLGFGLLGCFNQNSANPFAPGDDRTIVAPPTGNVMAIVEYGGGVDFTDPAVIAAYSKARVLVVQAPMMWRDDIYQGAVAELKRANPALKVIGYVNAHSTWTGWGDGTLADPEVQHYEVDWDRALRPYWSYSTTGDTMMSWPGKVVVNMLDPGCREAMVQVLADHWTAHSNTLDGIFWDHFNLHLWTSSGVPGLEGDLDLNGNGIAHRDDEPEMEAYRAASVALIQRTREVLGGQVIQITNGNRAAVDPEFAALVDGTMYERFPEVGFWGDRMRQALDPEFPHNLITARSWLRTQNGGPYVILSHTGSITHRNEDAEVVQIRRAEFNRAVALLTGTLVAYHPYDGSTHYGWPEIEVDLGVPLTGARFYNDTVTRDFERGSVTVDLSQSSDWLPFSFAIEQEGTIVQEFEIPSGTP